MKRLLIVIAVLVLLGASGWAGLTRYRSWKQTSQVAKAKLFMAQGDQANAVLSLQGALRGNPNDVEACLLFAVMADSAGSRNALFWRRRVVELQPTTANKLALARSALANGEYVFANETLRSIESGERNTAAYHRVVALLASSLNQNVEAEEHARKAVEAEPSNKSLQFDLAVIQLAVNTTNSVRAGRAALEQLAGHPEMACDAYRQLIADALTHGLADRALDFAEKLLSQSGHQFSDQILKLAALHLQRSPDANPVLRKLQEDSSSEPDRILSLSKWMWENGQSREALDWIERIPASTRTNPPVACIRAECYARTEQWPELQAAVLGQNWGRLEYRRHAFAALALRSQENRRAAFVHWRRSLYATGKRLEPLKDLAHRASEWKWDVELDQVLWNLIDAVPPEKTAFSILYDRLSANGNTIGLKKLLRRATTISPSNTELRNNLAIITLVLDPRSKQGHDLAREVYQADTNSPYFLSTYAFSMFLQRKTPEALKLFEQLRPEQLTDPAIAAYYGIILAGAGERARALPYLDLAERAALLPEERYLIRRARLDI